MKKHVIFYAEDDSDDLELMQETVKKLEPQHELVAAADGHEAVVKLQKLRESGDWPCVIILDGNMPKLNGEETVEMIKDYLASNRTPVCIFSTSPPERYSEIADKYGVQVYRKPTSLNELHATIRKLLNHCQK